MGLPTPQDGQLPGLPALQEACRAFGVNAADAQLLHHRSNAVYLLPHEQLIARLAPDTLVRRRRAETSIAVTRWLNDHPEPIALAPVAGEQPVIAAGAVATFWPLRATSPRSSVSDLAVLLRRLHSLPVPPFPVPRYQPLQRLREALELDQARPQPAVASQDRAWLLERADQLIDKFESTQFPLGEGLIHADAHGENLVYDGQLGQWLLIDWDGACIGPRELDLLTGIPDHFQEPAADRTRFLTTYGYNILDWPDWTLLRDITELHALGAYIRLAPTVPSAGEELRRRTDSLQTNNRAARWHAIR